jgi:ADP-heptose:LPS heptosyltransferase
MVLNSVRTASQCVMLYWCDSLVRLISLASTPSGRQKVLIVRLDGIGDFILWLDAVRALSCIFPPEDYSVTLLANSAWAPLAMQLKVFEEVIPLDRQSFVRDISYRFSMGRRLRRMGFSLVFQPTYSREFFFGDAIVRICGAQSRIGLDGDRINTSLWGKRIADRWYSRLIATGGPGEMELLRNARVVRELGCKEFLAALPQLSVTHKAKELKRAPYYVLHPGAGIPTKRWPPERFAALATLVHDAVGLRGIICGGADDREIGQFICDATSAPLINACGTTTITELVDIIANATFLVGNDTGALHIAAATGTPAVCILGAGELGRFFPYKCEAVEASSLMTIISHGFSCSGCGWFCEFDLHPGMPAPCVVALSTEEVWKALKNLVGMNIYVDDPSLETCDP